MINEVKAIGPNDKFRDDAKIEVKAVETNE
jgi:hypothetical protein